MCHAGRMTDAGAIDGVERGLVHGLDALIVHTPQASAAVSLFGGQLLSFLPADSGDVDVLWVSRLLAAPPTPIRGGTPICWPYFGREGQTGDVPSHGYARTATWELTGGHTDHTGEIELVLAPVGLDDLELRLSMTIRVGAVLHQEIHTHNPGAVPVPITEAFHNYFRVSDAAGVRVAGLDGLTYLDKFDDLRAVVQEGDWVLPSDVVRSDRVYPDAPGRYRLIDPGLRRAVTVAADGGRTAVVWNPGPDAAADMADVGAHWREFVCVEAANAGPDVVRIPPGDTHTLGQTISVSVLD